MTLFLRVTGALLVISVLVGCAMPAAIKPNVTSADELLKRLGQPTDIHPAPGGGERWEYAYGPEGTQTWRFGVDRGRMVHSSEQLLTEERLHRVVPGVTTEAQTRELLGRPREIVQLREELVWEWRVDLSPNLGVFVVRFGPDGRATGVNVLVDSSSDSDKKGDR